MKRTLICAIGLLFITIISCNDDDFDFEVEIPDFNFPQTIVYEDKEENKACWLFRLKLVDGILI